jgi:Holliday junction resolvase RusA-like endonuclease
MMTPKIRTILESKAPGVIGMLSISGEDALYDAIQAIISDQTSDIQAHMSARKEELNEYESMKIIRSTFFPIVPKAAMRATTNEYWLTKITEEEAIALDNAYEYRETSIGPMWVKERRMKNGEVKEFAKKSPPTYARRRRHLIANIENKKAIQDYGTEIGYKIPEDWFCIVVQVNMPKSWTKKKKKLLAWDRHKSRPDFDNVQKQIVDALYYKRSRFDREKGDEDARISSSAFIKVWVPDDVAPGFYINEYDPRLWDDAFLTQHLRRLALT